MVFSAKVITVSDGVIAKTREDLSGAAVFQRLSGLGFSVVERSVIADGRESVSCELRRMADGFSGLVVTTGGTGFSQRDLTPEGTLDVIERHAPGLGEAMRAISPLGKLSRAMCGTVGNVLIVNLPGSPKGAIECLDAIEDTLEHALSLLVDSHSAHPNQGD